MSNYNPKVAEYLSTLNTQWCDTYCKSFGVDFTKVIPFDFTNGDEVYDCLKTFLEEGVPVVCLFNCSEIWGIYLKSIVEERYHTGLDLVLSMQSPLDVIMYFRACYRFGFPAIDDKSFDTLEALYIQSYPALSFLNEQTYDDDDYNSIVMEAIRLSGVKNTGKTVVSNPAIAVQHEDYANLNTEKSTSIRPVVSAEEAFSFWKSAPMCRVHFSLKIDGVNTKVSVAKDVGLKLALSRGRSADSIDYTVAIQQVIKNNDIKAGELDGTITGESFVGLKELKIIQSRYPDKAYKTPKSTAMAMLRAPSNFVEEDYKYLSFYAFDYNGQPPNIAFEALSNAGFETPPYLVFRGDIIPRDSLDNFNEWMESHVLDPLWRSSERLGIGSDGVVMYLLADIATERKDKYSDSNIAIKYSHWAAATYSSVVKRIIFEQRRIEASIVLEIEPVIMRDSNTATRVGVGSPDILMRDGVRVGDEIEFERKSEAYNVYLRKK